MVKHPARLTYRGLTAHFIDRGYFCRIPLRDIAIDADGAPDAYGPPRFAGDLDGCGTDTLKNAGYPTNAQDPIPDDWRDVLVQDPHDPDKPLLKADGFYVSKTSLGNPLLLDDAAAGKYVDASRVAYIVMPQFWIDHLGVRLGDLCLLWHGRIKRRVVAIVADICPVAEPLGEISIAAAVGLGGKNVSPRTGVDFPGNGTIHCAIFKQSRPKLEWPLTNEFVQSFEAKLNGWLGR